VIGDFELSSSLWTEAARQGAFSKDTSYCGCYDWNPSDLPFESGGKDTSEEQALGFIPKEINRVSIPLDGNHPA
jgi:hypothetical protein